MCWGDEKPASNRTGLSLINKSGHTQFHVAFATADTDNDYITWYPAGQPE
ncbi:MAG: hypothetical protein NDI75_03905 [Candidatus Didemnitutus sp.]|nr:hypothetical protein [Candidatus Didemnitutus sp.]